MQPGSISPPTTPEGLWPELKPLPHSRWYVVQTLSRQEKALAEALEARGVYCFLPLVQTVRTYAHRKRVSDIPLFSGYVFLWGQREDGFFAVQTKRVANLLDVTDQARLHRELTQIRSAYAAGVRLDPYPYLEVGRRVRVAAGPLRGVEGIIETKDKVDRLILLVQALGQAVSTEVDASVLEPAE